METAEYGSEGSMDRQLEVFNASIDASIRRFKVAFQELSTDLINSDLLKGLIDAGTHIIQIIDELVKHIGVLGTALTGLGIAKIFSTAASGAKSVEGLTPAVSLLSEALSTGAGKGEAFGLVLEQLGAKAAGAGSALGTMFSSLGGFLASPAGWVTGIVAAVAAAGAIAYNIRKKQQEELKKQATATTEKWGDDKSSVDDFKRQYTELNDQLKDANLTESERIGIKQQLLDLQNQISAKYGADAGQLDLINGKYETQLGLISQITEKEAWNDCVEELSKSEHARWVVEKLIMGFRPLNEKERMKDEVLFGAEKRQYRNKLKKNALDPTHIDLCSFAELRRINPSDLKYDSFLMLAIPGILEKLS